MKIKHIAVVALLVVLAESRKYYKDCYKSTRLNGIPDDHLYFQLKHPIVIGHMGNIKKYQENTMEGMKSLIQMKAGGMHMQVRMTKDNLLILFGDDDLKRLTGYNYLVRKLPYIEILKMPLLKTIEYRISDSQTVKMAYPSQLKIPLLKDVLMMVKGKKLLIYIELLPNNVPPNGPMDRYRGQMLSKLVAGLIKELRMEKEVIVVSKDAFKLKSFNHYAPNIASGWWMDRSMFTKIKGDGMRKYYHEIPDIYYFNCFENVPNGTMFTEYLLNSGIVSKAVNASLVDLSMDIYNDKKDSIKGIVQNNYGEKASLGAFDIYSWNLSSTEKNSNDFTYVKKALDYGVTRFITDDVHRVKVALHEAKGGASTVTCYYTLVIVTILIGKAIVTLIFI